MIMDQQKVSGGIIKAEMYQMYEITDESSLRFAIKDYIRFYSEERPQDRYCCKTPLEVRQEALKSDIPVEYPIPENKRIKKNIKRNGVHKNTYTHKMKCRYFCRLPLDILPVYLTRGISKRYYIFL